MQKIVIRGGARLVGEVRVSGSKNAALPILASALLAGGRSTFRNVPALGDVRTMGRLLARLGAEVTDGPTCKVEGCKQGVRAKGLCRKHFMGWRRGSLGDHHRYKICSKEGCRKPRAKAGFCAEHAGIKAPEAAAPEGGAAA